MTNLLDTKNEGQVFTPEGIVIMILDEIGYKTEKTLDKTIMEPSFGDGAFLIQIVERIITQLRKDGKSNDAIVQTIKRNVYGIEKDATLYKATINRLNDFLLSCGIDVIDWTNNLFNGDTLELFSSFKGKFDYIVGNPPYVRIHNINDNTRAIIDTFEFSNGTTDMYIIFYEISLKMLNSKGKLGFITPNSFMKNTSQKNFRNYLIKKQYITKIFDFKTSKIFKNADVYTCICIMDKDENRINKSIEYREYSMDTILQKNIFPFEYFQNELKNKAWNLSSEEDILFLQEIKSRPIKIGDIAIVQNGISTNRDKVYIAKAWKDKEETIPYMGKHTDKETIVYFNGYQIESTILHRCIKASKYNGTILNNYILFPYKSNNTIKIFVDNKIIETLTV